MVRDSATFGKFGGQGAKEKTIGAVIQNHYLGLEPYAAGASRLLAYIQTV